MLLKTEDDPPAEVRVKFSLKTNAKQSVLPLDSGYRIQFNVCIRPLTQSPDISSAVSESANDAVELFESQHGRTAIDTPAKPTISMAIQVNQQYAAAYSLEAVPLGENL